MRTADGIKLKKSFELILRSCEGCFFDSEDFSCLNKKDPGGHKCATGKYIWVVDKEANKKKNKNLCKTCGKSACSASNKVSSILGQHDVKIKVTKCQEYFKRK